MTSTSRVLGICILFIVLGLIPGPITPMMAPCPLAESFNLKTGAREMTHASVITGMLIPPDVLAKMPLERHAKLEKAMQARSGQPKIRTTKSCMTQRDLDQNRLIKEEGEGEEPQRPTQVLSKSSSRLIIERAWLASHASTSQMTVEATTPETVEASLDRALEGSGKIHMDIKGHWLGTSCDEIKDRC